MVVRLAIFGGILAGFIFLSACASYRQERKAEAEEKARNLAKLEESGRVERGKIKLPTARERVEEVPEAALTPSPTPETLLNRPLDPAGDPQPPRD